MRLVFDNVQFLSSGASRGTPPARSRRLCDSTRRRPSSGRALVALLAGAFGRWGLPRAAPHARSNGRAAEAPSAIGVGHAIGIGGTRRGAGALEGRRRCILRTRRGASAERTRRGVIRPSAWGAVFRYLRAGGLAGLPCLLLAVLAGDRQRQQQPQGAGPATAQRATRMSFQTIIRAGARRRAGRRIRARAARWPPSLYVHRGRRG